MRRERAAIRLRPRPHGRMLLAIAAAAALAMPAAAGAAPGLEVGMEDERLLLGPSAAEAASAVEAWAAAGVDVVRVHARWADVAPGRGDRRRPAGFDAADPGDPRYRWAVLDRAVSLVTDAGMAVMLTVTGPGPLWSSRAPTRRDPRYKPDPRAFRDFAGAVALRYGPRVDRYLLWNEPNQPGWLHPQHDCRGTGRRRACTPVAPHLYRALVAAAAPAIERADPGAQIVIGELAPIGREAVSASSAIPPLTFLRAMACVDERYRPLPRRGPCARFTPVRADALGHHPHGVLTPPDRPSPRSTWAKLGDLGRLVRVLDRLARSRRLLGPPSEKGRLPLHLTEFGYQTSPPDHAIGVTLAQQARYLQQAAYIAWRHPRVRSLVHYQWVDEPVRYRAPGTLAYAGWQSGLFLVDGEPKPALRGFAAPFVLDVARGGRRGRVWGQVRAGAAHRVTLLRRAPGGEFRPLAEVQTGADGAWSYALALDRAGELRYEWSVPAGDAPPVTRTSGVLAIGPRASPRLRAASVSAGG